MLCLFITCWETLWVLIGMGWVEINFVSSIGLEGFGQHMLRYILFHCWHGRCSDNTYSGSFCVLAGIGEVCSKYILSPQRHGMGLVNTFWDTFFFPRWYGRGMVNTGCWHGRCVNKCWGASSDYAVNRCFGQHLFRKILCTRWYEIVVFSTRWDIPFLRKSNATSNLMRILILKM